MALGDIGMFLPSESQYGSPGSYDQLLKSEATKRASYLASMDQFYTQLEESKRQFDKTLDFQIESRDLEYDFKEKQLAQQKDIAEMQLGADEYDPWSTGDVSDQEQLDFLKDLLKDGSQRSSGANDIKYYVGPEQKEVSREEYLNFGG